MTDLATPVIATRPLSEALPWAVLGIWATAVASLAANGAFVEPPDALPMRLAMAVAVPVSLFLASWAVSPAVRAWVATRDLGLVIAAQTWRVLGVVFLFLWALGDLPAVFAFPAALGDIAVGIFAVTVTLAVARRTTGWQGKARLLIIVGLLDFVLAFASAILAGEGRPLQFAGEPLPVMMQSLPMVLIPTFGVPLFTILHLIAWIRLRDAHA